MTKIQNHRLLISILYTYTVYDIIDFSEKVCDLCTKQIYFAMINSDNNDHRPINLARFKKYILKFLTTKLSFYRSMIMTGFLIASPLTNTSFTRPQYYNYLFYGCTCKQNANKIPDGSLMFGYQYNTFLQITVVRSLNSLRVLLF